MYLPQFDEKEKQALTMAIKALEEIQQYRTIGTVEEFKAMVSENFTKDLLNVGYAKGIKDGYTKAINEFAERLEDSLIHNYRHLLRVDADGFEWLTTDAVGTHINEVAEEMRGGE